MCLPPLVILVGPTAVGKSDVSLALAQRLTPAGEIVSADSRTFYRGMDIGTAKPTTEARARVPHHLVDVTTPDRPWSLADFQRAARAAIADVHARGRVPLLVGGTGQYVRAVAEAWELPASQPDESLRAELEATARTHGAQALHARLQVLDPEAAQRVDPRNVRRVIRAIEIARAGGRGRKGASPYTTLTIGLTRPREELYRRVDARINAMLAAGWLGEVRRLMAQGYDWSLPAMSALGYRQLGSTLRGECSLEDAVRDMRRASRMLVRRQANWFKPDDPTIRWFQMDGEVVERVGEYVQRWLSSLPT